MADIDLRARDNTARCPYCRADLRAGEDTWTCAGCQAQQHVECMKEAGGGCVGCRAPAKAPPRPAPPPGIQPLLHALGDGYRAQAGMLAIGALTGGLLGGKPGLLVCASAPVFGAVVSGSRASPNGLAAFLVHLISSVPLGILCMVGIDALDVPGGRASFAMFGLGLLLAAVSAGISAFLRRA